MHLPLALLVSMPVIFCLHPSSSIVILEFYLFSTGISEQHVCEGSEDMAGKISENRHFRGPHSHLKPPCQRSPPNIRINLISLETAIHGLHFCR